MKKPEEYILPVVKSYAEVLFNSNLFCGFVILLLSFFDPNLGIAGFISVVSAYVFARALGFKKEFLKLEYYIYNPLLVGLSLGYLFKATPISVLFFAIAGIFTFILTYFLASTFSYYFKLPVLSVPFVITSSLLYLASSKFSNLFIYNLYPHRFFSYFLELNLPVFLTGYFKSLGAIFFLPHCIAGIIIFIILLYVSRILTLLSLIGYFSGVFVKGILSGSFYQAFLDTSAFNYILTSMAIGGVFLIPSLKSYEFAIVSSVISVPVVEGLKVVWENFGVPVFALPFNMVSLLFLYVIISLNYYYATKLYRGTPERTLDHYLTYIKRFPFTGREIHLPFSGEWTVWQSFDGEWTHKGAWKYAVDFVITDEEGKTYSGEGSFLEDYYAFGKPVLSPVEGKVIDVVNTLEDNPPGKVDKKNNWGNYVIIQDSRGFYVLICHFKKNSIKVKPGDFVSVGKLLGFCGNSGYSPQPHIHIQVQLLPNPGAPTVPFSFVSYTINNKFKDLGVPQKGEKVAPVFPEKSLFNRLNLLIDQKMKFLVKYLNKKGLEKVIEVVVKMAPDGTFYLTDGKARLYFGIYHSTFYFYSMEGDLASPLKFFFFAVPKLPLSFKENLVWQDYLPLSTLSSWKRELFLFLSSFKNDLFEVKFKGRYIDLEELESKIIMQGEVKKAKVKLAYDYGFEEIVFEDVKISRIREEK